MMQSDQQRHEGSDVHGGQAAAPVISVIIPAYNSAVHVPNAIDAVRAQTFTDWEVIVVDDCSPDDTAAALARYDDDDRVRLVRHAENLGASAARNTGISEAQGRFIAFLDADDLWMPTKLQRQMEAVFKYSEPDRAFCVTSTIVRLNDDRHLIRPKRPKRPDERMDEFIFVHAGFCQTSSFLLSTELARAVGWRELPIGEDHMFAIDALNAGAEYILIEEPLVIYDDEPRPGRLSATASLSNGQIFMNAVRDTLSRKAMLAYHSRYLGVALLRSDPVKGVSVLASALRAGSISPRFAATLLARTVIPQRRYQRLRARLLGRGTAGAGRA